MTVVIDASVAVKWFFAESGHLQARALLDDEAPLIAPALVLAEVANAAWKRYRRGEITRDYADEVARLVPLPFSELVAIERLFPEAAHLSTSLDHPVYDCFYIALAARDGLPLATADCKVAALARGIGVGATLLAD